MKTEEKTPTPKKKPTTLEAPAAVLLAERAVLGSMLLEREAAGAAIDVLKAEDFYKGDNRKVYAAILRVLARDRAVDLVTVSEEMRATNELATINPGDVKDSGVGYLAGCIEAVSTTAHVQHYAHLVKEAALDRAFVRQLHACAADKTPENVRALHDILTALHGVRHDKVLDFQRDLPAALEAMEKAKPQAMDTGFPELDRLLQGVKPGDICTVGARTSGGKTAFMTKAALQMAAAGIPALYLTTEMSEQDMLERVLPAAANVPAWRLRKRLLDATDWKKLVDGAAGLSRLPVKIHGKPTFTMEQIRAVAVQAKPRVVFVDYLQRCRYPAGDVRAYQVMDFMVALKSFAQEAGVAVFIGCQLDRKLDRAPAGEPENADLKDSGAIEAESDQVVLLWRPTEKELIKELGYQPPPSGHKIVRLKISKNRHGGAGDKVDLLLRGAFVDLMERFAPKQQEEMRYGGD